MPAANPPPRPEHAGRIRVGISSCLLGNPVRHDGGHKHDRYITDVLGQHFEYVPICPEAAIGLGVPRPAIRLTGSKSAPRAVGVKDPSMEVTGPLLDYAEEMAEPCRALAGYLFKRGSPSCGMARVKVYTDKGMPGGSAAGLYAARLMERLPLMPCEEEGRLNDPVLRENFVTRVFVYDRWQRLIRGGLSAGALVDFHTRHKFLLLSHSETHYRQLGRLVAASGRGDLGETAHEYIRILMEGLGRRATRRRHGNVLQHLMGYLKRDLDGGDKAELLGIIDEYRTGKVPLVVPLKLLKHHFRRNPSAYVAFQYYMDPHPEALMLRNAI
jgi:uncharacterized protein YbgA (DUF1722 family)/uncharacterized protein YbbK (DUF523 family)